MRVLKECKIVSLTTKHNDLVHTDVTYQPFSNLVRVRHSKLVQRAVQATSSHRVVDGT